VSSVSVQVSREKVGRSIDFDAPSDLVVGRRCLSRLGARGVICSHAERVIVVTQMTQMTQKFS